MKRQSFRALRGRRDLNSDKDTVHRIVFFLYNNSMNLGSFRASRGIGGETKPNKD